MAHVFLFIVGIRRRPGLTLISWTVAIRNTMNSIYPFSFWLLTVANRDAQCTHMSVSRTEWKVDASRVATFVIALAA